MKLDHVNKAILERFKSKFLRPALEQISWIFWGRIIVDKLSQSENEFSESVLCLIFPACCRLDAAREEAEGSQEILEVWTHFSLHSTRRVQTDWPATPSSELHQIVLLQPPAASCNSNVKLQQKSAACTIIDPSQLRSRWCSGLTGWRDFSVCFYLVVHHCSLCLSAEFCDALKLYECQDSAGRLTLNAPLVVL